MRIALDAMGGDHAPGPIVAGTVEAVRMPDLTVVLVGDHERIEADLARRGATPARPPANRAGQMIGMDEKPVDALRKKRDNSISRSGGRWPLANAGGRLGGQHRRHGGLGDVQRQDVPAGRAAAGDHRDLPSHRGPVVIFDVGANMDATPEDLYQYGVMGLFYAEHILGVTHPRSAC